MVKDIMWRFMLSKRAGSYVRSMSWLTVVSIALSLAALILITSVMNGFNNTMLSNIVSAEPDLVITHENNVDQIDERLSSMSVRSIQKVALHDVIIKTIDGSFGGAIAKGMTQVAIDDFQSELPKIKEQHSVALKPGEVILGRALANSLGILTGDEVIILPPDALLQGSAENFIYEKLTVAGFFESLVDNLDSSLVLYNKSTTLLTARLSKSFSSQTEVQLFEPFLADDYKKEFVAHKLKVESWGDRNSALILALKLEKIAMTTFLALGALITSFSVATVLILLINQKKKEWGIFMTMGMSRTKTRNLFARIGLYLSSIGVIAGFVIGLGLSLFLMIYRPCWLPQDLYLDCRIPAEVRPVQLVIIFICSIVITLIASFLPAQIYSKLKPYESIKS